MPTPSIPTNTDLATRLAARLDRLFLDLRSVPFLHRFTLFTRILLAAGFVPTGLVKVLGRRFTQISVDTPAGAFFEAMFQTGLYWQFLGASQMLAGLLLLWPRGAHLGAALFLPIMVNILVITVAIGFTGTPTVTALMVLAVLYLVAWDFHRYRGLLFETPAAPPLDPPTLRLEAGERLGFWIFGLALMSFFLWTRGLAPRSLGAVFVLVGVLGGLLALVRFVTHGRHLRPAE